MRFFPVFALSFLMLSGSEVLAADFCKDTPIDQVRDSALTLRQARFDLPKSVLLEKTKEEAEFTRTNLVRCKLRAKHVVVANGRAVRGPLLIGAISGSDKSKGLVFTIDGDKTVDFISCLPLQGKVTVGQVLDALKNRLVVTNGVKDLYSDTCGKVITAQDFNAPKSSVDAGD